MPSAPTFRNAEKVSSTPLLKQLAMSSHLSHTDHKTMAVLLPCLHHRSLAKPPPRYKHRALASVIPFPRSNVRVKKSSLKLMADEPSIMPSPGHRNEPGCLLDSDHHFLTHSSPNHFPKIFPGYKNRTEIIPHPDQKGTSPSTSAHKADIPLGEGDKNRTGPASRGHLDSQTGGKSGPATTAQPTKPSLRHRRSQVRTASMLLGFNKKGDRPTASTSSHCLKDWSKAKSLKPPDLAKVLKKSHSDLCPRNMVSLAGYTKSESKTLTLSSSHPEQKNKGTSAPSPSHQATFLREVESWEEAVTPLIDDQTILVADKNHDVAPLLSQINSEFWDTPNAVSKAKDLPDPNIPFMLQTEQDLREKMTEEMEYQAITPASRHHETTHLLSAPQDGSSDRWVKLAPSPPHQAEATPRLFANVSVQTDQTSLLHASVQTEEGIWQTMLMGINHQAATQVGSAHGATSPLELNPNMTVSGLNHHPTASQNPVYQTGNMVDINPPLILQAEGDALGEMEQEIELDQVTFFIKEDHGPMDLDPQDKTLLGSDYQATVQTSQDSGTISPMALGPQKKILPKPGQHATSLTNAYNLTKETHGHLACVSVQKAHKPCDKMPKTYQQATILIDQDCGTAFSQGLDSKDTPQLGFDHQPMYSPSPDNQAEHLSELDIQLMFQKEQERALRTHHQTTLLTDQGPGAAFPFNLDPQNKSLPVSDHWVTTPSATLDLGPQNKTSEAAQCPMVLTNPHHLNHTIQGHLLKISVPTRDQAMSRRTDQQATTLRSQVHKVTVPLLVLDTQGTLSPSLDHQATFPLGSAHQVWNIPDPEVQFTIQEQSDSLGEVVQKAHHQTPMLAGQSWGIITPWNLDSENKILSASAPHTTTLRSQDHETTPSLISGPQNKTLSELDQQVKDAQSPVTKDFIQTEQEPWETLPQRRDHQAMTVPMHLDTQDKSIRGPDRQSSALTGQNYEKPPPMDKTQFKPENGIKPLVYPYPVVGDAQGQTLQASLKTEQDPQDPIPAGTNNQTPILKGQVRGTVPLLATLLEIDQQLSTSPPPHHRVKDTPNHVPEILTDHQDYGTSPVDSSPGGFDHWASSRYSPNQQDKMVIDHTAHVTLQSDLNHWEMSQEKDLNHINLVVEDFSDSPPFLDLGNQERTRPDLDNWDIHASSASYKAKDAQYPKALVSPQSEQDQRESIPQGMEPKTISQEISLMALGLQDQTLPLRDHKAMPQTSPEYSAEDTSNSVIHACPQMVQESLEKPPTAKGQQPAAPSVLDPDTTPAMGFQEDKGQPALYHLICLPSPDHQSEGKPASSVHASTQTEQDLWKMMPSRKDLQVKAQRDRDHEVTPLASLDQNEVLTNPRLQATPSINLCEQTGDIQRPIVHISLQTDPELWETIPPGMDSQTTTPKAPVLPVSLDSQKTPLLDSNYQDTNMLSPDQQVGDIQRPVVHVFLEKEPKNWETLTSRINHYQDTTVKGQGNGSIPFLSLDSQGKTLSALNLQDTRKFIPDQIMVPVQSSNAHVSFTTEPKYKETMILKGDYQVANHVSQVNGSAFPLHSVSWNPNQSSSNHQAITPPISPNHKTEVASNLHTHVTANSNDHHLPKLSINLNHKVMPKFITNLKPKQGKQNPWCFKYIEPYTVDGTAIPTEVMQTIISSIPQERIKNDISKQILLKRMKVSSAVQSGQRISSSYPVCLICASWIPDDCPHVQNMKYPCEAQLLAIPTPLSNTKEDMGVRFVFQTPQTKRFTFLLPEMHYISQASSHHSGYSSSSHSDESVRAPLPLKHQTTIPSPVPEGLKTLSFIMDKYNQPVGKATFRSQQSPPGIKPMKCSSREDDPKKHPIFFKSLLERFQLRQKVN
ncbi:uncharacterized protein LOC127554210 isoform X2 [Antechinus flavipes]|nr:uncharacterized protein LOC127554210 isoform X2 [Antechinus flavipes]